MAGAALKGPEVVDAGIRAWIGEQWVDADVAEAVPRQWNGARAARAAGKLQRRGLSSRRGRSEKDSDAARGVGRERLAGTCVAYDDELVRVSAGQTGA